MDLVIVVLMGYNYFSFIPDIHLTFTNMSKHGISSFSFSHYYPKYSKS